MLTPNDKEKMKTLTHAIRHVAYMEGILEGKSIKAPNSELRLFYSELKDNCEELVLHLQSRLEALAEPDTGKELFPNG